MYRAIIADDEITVRRGLQAHFNWEKFGISVIADFSDGQKAWHFVQDNPVDLIVTDVRMPNMDGIALAKAVREQFPKVKIIFISGYEDTEYLRKALKMEAVDYILKSIDLDELAETISRVTKQMDFERSQENTIAVLEQKLIESIPLLQQRSLMLLVREGVRPGGNTISEMEARLSYLDLPLDNQTNYCILVLQLKDMWRMFAQIHERDRLIFTLNFQTTCEQILAEYGSRVCFENRLGEYVLFIDTRSEEYEELLLSISQCLRAALKESCGLDCRIGISDRFCGLNHAKTAFEGAVNAIHKRYYLDESHAISVDKFEESVTIRSAQENAQRSIADALMSGDAARVRASVEKTYEELEVIPSETDRQNFLLFLLLLPVQVLANARSGERGSYDNHAKLLERFLCCGDIREQKLFVLNMFDEVTQLINTRSETHSHYIIERVRDIIQTRYMEQLSIASLAEEVYLTPTYLCVVFKQETGQTVNEYLTQIRMQQAKQFLADPHIKLYDVCYKVGYLSPSYFSKLFKKVTMMTPSEFRDVCLQQS